MHPPGAGPPRVRPPQRHGSGVAAHVLLVDDHAGVRAALRASLRRILDGEAVLAPEVLPGVVAELAGRLRAEHDRAEALRTVGRAKEEFLSLISDRLATPLTAITGYTKTLTMRWDRLDEETKA